MNRVLYTLCVVTLVLFWLGQQNIAGATISAADMAPFGNLARPTNNDHHYVSQLDMGPVSLDYYHVEGDSIGDLRSSIDQNRRHGWDAYTQWQVYWNWPGRGLGGQCDLHKAQLITSLSLSFPQWQTPEQPNAYVASRWDHYVHGLATHERMHLENARKGFERMRAVIAKGDCATAEAELHTIVTSMRAFDEQYDANTHHGVDQGAYFP